MRGPRRANSERPRQDRRRDQPGNRYRGGREDRDEGRHRGRRDEDEEPQGGRAQRRMSMPPRAPEPFGQRYINTVTGCGKPKRPIVPSDDRAAENGLAQQGKNQLDSRAHHILGGDCQYSWVTPTGWRCDHPGCDEWCYNTTQAFKNNMAGIQEMRSCPKCGRSLPPEAIRFLDAYMEAADDWWTKELEAAHKEGREPMTLGELNYCLVLLQKRYARCQAPVGHR